MRQRGSDHGRSGVHGRHTSIVHRSFPNDFKAKTFRLYNTEKSTSARLPSQGPHPQHAPLAMVPTAKSDTNADSYMTNARFKLAEKVPRHMQQSTDIITTTRTITSIRWCLVPCSRSTAIIVSAAAGGLHTVLVTADGTARTFGRNGFGQCDIPDFGGREPSVQLPECSKQLS